MDILPMDVIQIMLNLYYTPQLKSIENDDQFYLQIIYPQHQINMRVPPLSVSRYGKSYRPIYDTQTIINVINQIDQNEETQLILKDPFDFNLTVNKNNVTILVNDIQMTITIKNTEAIRQQLLDVLSHYYEFMSFYSPD
jgi:hypothetical protein